MARTMGDTGIRLGMRTGPGREPCQAFQDEACVRYMPEPDIRIQPHHECPDDGAWFCSCGAVVDDGSEEDWKKTWMKTTVGDCPTCGRVYRTWFFDGFWQTTNTTKEGQK